MTFLLPKKILKCLWNVTTELTKHFYLKKQTTTWIVRGKVGQGVSAKIYKALATNYIHFSALLKLSNEKKKSTSQTYHSAGILNKLPLAHWHSNFLETGIVMLERLWLVYLSSLQLFYALFTSIRYSINEKSHFIGFLLAAECKNYCLIKRLFLYSSFSLEITEQGMDGRVNWKWIVAHNKDFTEPRMTVSRV